MRESVRDKDRLLHIVEAIDTIFGRMDGLSQEKLSDDKVFYHGIVKNIEIVGEAAYHLTKAFRSLHREIPWETIIRMRHVLVHDYYRISLKEVWQVVNKDLSPLREQIVKYIEQIDWQEWEDNELPQNESAVHKQLIESATRMKKDGLPSKLISRYTGLTNEEIDAIVI